MINLDKGEKIKYIARRHSLAYILEVFLLLVAAILPYLVYLHNQLYWVDTFFGATGSQIFFLHLSLYSLWLLFIWILFFIAWSDYYLDVWIITDGRIIDVKQVGVFRRKINTFRLDKITNLNISKTHTGWLLNYGTLEVSLDQPELKLVVAEVPQPEMVKEIILLSQKELLERLQQVMTKVE